MAMRISGLMSGMDTESIISQLVEAKSTTLNKTKKAQLSLKYKQDAWKTLNTQIISLYSKTLSNMRFESSFIKKTTKVSNSSVVSVITGDGAMNSVQTLKVNKLATSGYLTGDKVQRTDGEAVTGDTKLSEMGFGGSCSMNVHVGGSEVGDYTINVNENTTINDVVSQLRNAGLNANFDEANGRLYIASASSGEANDFSITGSDDVGSGSAVMQALGIDYTHGQGHKDDAQDAEITLNGVNYTSSSNTFAINGLTLTVNATTAPNESVTLTTQDDTDGIYDMIKNFFKEYNSLINQMDKLYNADSASEYEPLLSEEKEAMSDSEIEEWETKVKDAVLRKDSTLSTFSTALKQIMMEGVEVNGTKMYLSNFGINTLGYFVSAENEKNAYHIDGDPDDADTSGNTDKLKSMIANDPQTVVSFFTGLAKNLYDKMTELTGTSEYSSFNSAYDDKKMQTEYDDYTTKIKELEDKLADYEDKWYAKFAAMETALAKLQQNASAVTALLGGSSY